MLGYRGKISIEYPARGNLCMQHPVKREVFTSMWSVERVRALLDILMFYCYKSGRVSGPNADIVAKEPEKACVVDKTLVVLSPWTQRTPCEIHDLRSTVEGVRSAATREKP